MANESFESAEAFDGLLLLLLLLTAAEDDLRGAPPPPVAPRKEPRRCHWVRRRRPWRWRCRCLYALRL